jgi:hypothetical protein
MLLSEEEDSKRNAEFIYLVATHKVGTMELNYLDARVKFIEALEEYMKSLKEQETALLEWGRITSIFK